MSDWLSIDPLDALTIRESAATSWLGRVLEVHRTIGSTNDQVRGAQQSHEAEPGFTVIAEEQVAGRGRHGRRWVALPGIGLSMSCLIDATAVAPGVLTLSLAVAVRDGIEAATGFAPSVKWPNDLEAAGRKLCGILVEALGGGAAVLGIGVNVHRPGAGWPAELAERASCLDAATGVAQSRNLVAARILEAVESVLDELRSGGGESLLERWRSAASHLGARVEVVAGERSATGVCTGIDDDGALLLRRDDGASERVLAGSVRVLDEPSSRPDSDRPDGDRPTGEPYS